MPFVFRSQPLKALYVTYTTGSVIVRLPLWVLYYAIPGTRPRRSWTLSRTLINALYRVFIDYMWATQPMLMPTPAAVEAGGTADADGLVWIDATPQLVTDDIARLARVNGVEAEKTAGYWFGPRGVDGKAGQKAGPNEKVVYYFHGGAFVQMSGRPTGLIKTLYEALREHLPHQPRIFASEYRLASAAPFKPANPFPAALLDGLAGYAYLVRDLGFKPENILLTGDSSGGATAFWLARYLAAAQLPGLPGPSGLLLLSPTADVAHTHRGRGSSMSNNAASDSVGSIFSSGYSFRALLGALDPAHAAVLAWVAPGARGLETEGLFVGLPPTYVCAGGAEQTLDGIVALRERIVADNGKHRVEWDAPQDATHDYLLAPWHEPERTETLKRIGAWAAKECWPSQV